MKLIQLVARMVAVLALLTPMLGCDGTASNNAEKPDAMGADLAGIETAQSDAYVSDTSGRVVGNQDSSQPSQDSARLTDGLGADASTADTGVRDTGLFTDLLTQSGDAGVFSASSTKTLSQLTTSELQILCDQVAGNQGGYGRVVPCDGSTQTTDSSQGSCVGGIPFIALQCPTLTVGNLVGCSLATGPDLCSYPIAPECAAVFNCLG